MFEGRSASEQVVTTFLTPGTADSGFHSREVTFLDKHNSEAVKLARNVGSDRHELSMFVNRAPCKQYTVDCKARLLMNPEPAPFSFTVTTIGALPHHRTQLNEIAKRLEGSFVTGGLAEVTRYLVHLGETSSVEVCHHVAASGSELEAASLPEIQFERSGDFVADYRNLMLLLATHSELVAEMSAETHSNVLLERIVENVGRIDSERFKVVTEPEDDSDLVHFLLAATHGLSFCAIKTNQLNYDFHTIYLMINEAGCGWVELTCDHGAGIVFRLPHEMYGATFQSKAPKGLDDRVVDIVDDFTCNGWREAARSLEELAGKGVVVPLDRKYDVVHCAGLPGFFTAFAYLEERLEEVEKICDGELEPIFEVDSEGELNTMGFRSTDGVELRFEIESDLNIASAYRVNAISLFLEPSPTSISQTTYRYEIPTDTGEARTFGIGKRSVEQLLTLLLSTEDRSARDQLVALQTELVYENSLTEQASSEYRIGAALGGIWQSGQDLLRGVWIRLYTSLF